MRISDWSSDVCSSDLRVREGDLPQDDVVPRLTALGFPLGQAACDPGQAARRIDERAPKGSRFPPARISCVGPKPHEERDGSAEQRRRQRRFLDRGHHVECRHRHVPHEQDRERLPNLDNDLPKTWPRADNHRSEEHTSELQSLMRISYAVFCLKKKTTTYKYNKYKYT